MKAGRNLEILSKNHRPYRIAWVIARSTRWGISEARYYGSRIAIRKISW
jgi:hypothetical protein